MLTFTANTNVVLIHIRPLLHYYLPSTKQQKDSDYLVNIAEHLADKEPDVSLRK